MKAYNKDNFMKLSIYVAITGQTKCDSYDCLTVIEIASKQYDWIICLTF